MSRTDPDYIEVFLGSSWGGFVTSDMNKVKGGYDPGKRPWYADALSMPGQVFFTLGMEITNAMRIGQTGYVVLTKTDGTILADPRAKNRVLKNTSPPSTPRSSPRAASRRPRKGLRLWRRS